MPSVLLLALGGCRVSRPTPPPAPTPPAAPAEPSPAAEAPPYKFCRPWGLTRREPPTDLPEPDQEWTFGTIEAGDLGCYVSMCPADGTLVVFQGDYAICDARDAIGDWLGYQVQARFERQEAERICASENDCVDVPAHVLVTQLRRVGQTDWQPKG